VERLEDRLAPAVIVVTDTGDAIAEDGKVTLREALTSCNNNVNVNADIAGGAYAPVDTIEFDIQGAGVKTINLTDTLEIKEAVTIDGFTRGSSPEHRRIRQPHRRDTPDCPQEERGAEFEAGILITGNDSTVKGLVIQEMGVGIDIRAATTRSGVFHRHRRCGQRRRRERRRCPDRGPGQQQPDRRAEQGGPQPHLRKHEQRRGYRARER
jgi:hypothetical protein